VAKARVVDAFLIGNYLPLTIFSIALHRAGVEINEDNLARFKSSDAEGSQASANGLKQYNAVKQHIDELRGTIPRANLYEHDQSAERFEKLVAIKNEWSSYTSTSKTNGEPIKNLYRGDTDAIRFTYGWLDDFIKKTKDSTQQERQKLDLEVTIPPIMSTAKTDQPIQHQYMKKKSVLWHIEAEQGHKGLEIGLYQEEEITFPMCNKLLISELVYLPKGLSYRDDPILYGPDFKYVIVAKACA